jgi:hypothetical protein
MARPSSRWPSSIRAARRGGASTHTQAANPMGETAHDTAEQPLAIMHPRHEARRRISTRTHDQLHE